ncbi:carbamoyl-phosphate synthase L chain [Synechococcus sp. UW140]|uniref:carbamoyl-phosphate synthase L chain n=1 Tax=Synechococcus sp. UW140 TaxID=368503 RepID=UPI000E0FD878|nr:carbamoyl-phosphate synthase L chain [Synechococcus sp. UW140]
MQQSIRLSLTLTGAAALTLASIPQVNGKPAEVAQGTADDLGVMSINFKDVVKPQIGFQGALQGAGTPNQAGIGGFLPLVVGDNSVFFADVEANLNFADFNYYSSINNTTVAGTTISTSSRLGYRWLNGDQSWMFGINGGYDTRPMATGYADTGVDVSGKQTVFFQQAAFDLEAVNAAWALNAYGLIPTGTTEYTLNNRYKGGALDTYGLDVGYSITPDWNLSVGYYYQNGDLNTADGSGVKGRLAYAINNDLTIGTNISYDDAFDTRLSANIKWRFNTNGMNREKQKKAWEKPVIKAALESVKNRNVRVHDKERHPLDPERLPGM